MPTALFQDPLLWLSIFVVWTAFLLYLRRPRRPEQALSETSARLFLGALARSDDAVAFLPGDGGPAQFNAAWHGLFGADTGLPEALVPMAAETRPGRRELRVERAELGLPEIELPLGNEDAARIDVVICCDDPGTVILIPSTMTRDFALRVRQIAHNFNNSLSAVVGGAGMVMGALPEDSQTFRDLEQIEDAAMQAAELTSELQRAARNIAPPKAQTVQKPGG